MAVKKNNVVPGEPGVELNININEPGTQPGSYNQVANNSEAGPGSQVNLNINVEPGTQGGKRKAKKTKRNKKTKKSKRNKKTKKSKRNKNKKTKKGRKN